MSAGEGCGRLGKSVGAQRPPCPAPFPHPFAAANGLSQRERRYVWTRGDMAPHSLSMRRLPHAGRTELRPYTANPMPDQSTNPGWSR